MTSTNPEQEEKPELLHWFDKATEAALSMFHGSGSDDIAAQREIAECRAAVASIASNISAMTRTNLAPSEMADKIIADYKEHYSFPPQGESHMHDCIMMALVPSESA